MGFKRTERDFRRLLWEGRGTAIGVALGIYTVGGVILVLFDIPLYGKLIAAIAPALLGAVAGVWDAYHQVLPPLFSDELAKENRYDCKPCTQENLKLACEMVRPLFGVDHVDWALLEQWRIKNPKGFMQVVNEDGVLTACFVILSLEDAFFHELIKGNVAEADITGETVLQMREGRKQERIYISGVFVRDPGSYLGSKRARVMLWCMTKYLMHFYGTKRTLYAVALNRDSQRLLSALGFKVATPAASRKDHHDFYTLTLNEQVSSEVRMRLGDLSPCCTIGYT